MMMAASLIFYEHSYSSIIELNNVIWYVYNQMCCMCYVNWPVISIGNCYKIFQEVQSQNPLPSCAAVASLLHGYVAKYRNKNTVEFANGLEFVPEDSHHWWSRAMICFHAELMLAWVDVFWSVLVGETSNETCLSRYLILMMVEDLKDSLLAA